MNWKFWKRQPPHSKPGIYIELDGGHAQVTAVLPPPSEEAVRMFSMLFASLTNNGMNGILQQAVAKAGERQKISRFAGHVLTVTEALQRDLHHKQPGPAGVRMKASEAFSPRRVLGENNGD